MKLEVLISCMYQQDTSIILRTNVQSDVLVINQCDTEKTEEFTFTNKLGELCTVRIISTKERGLSKSRNMALRNAKGDICLICDDDEVLEDDYPERILNSFKEYPDATLLAFSLHHPRRVFPSNSFRIGYIKSFSIGSYQIAFFRDSLQKKSVCFDEKMGSGTGNGGGEENKFLLDCLKRGAKMWYVPLCIGAVAQTNSQWFHGYTEKYFRDRGWSSRRMLGAVLGYLYIWYWVVRKRSLYRDTCCMWKAIFMMHKGFVESR